MATFNRKVFYIGGFDPRGVRFYHQMLHEQLERYAERSGDEVTLSKRSKVGETRADWQIENHTRGVVTDYSFLRWEDIVRDAWISSPLALTQRAIRAYRGNIRELDFATGRKLGGGPLITLFYPAILAIAIPLLIVAILWPIASIWLPWWAGLAIGIVAAILATPPLLRRVHAPWLLRFFIFNAELGGGEVHPAIDARLDDFAEQIAAALDGPHDEVLLVTHSNGSILAVPLMTRLLARRSGAMPANFALVTLGHCIPLVACRRDATRFHDQLRILAKSDFRWIDIGSPPDGAAYCGVNPMLLVASETRPTMELLSPRFHLFYDPATYHKGYANKYEIHFDYLRCGDRLSAIDYPSLMTADRPIAASVAAFKAM